MPKQKSVRFIPFVNIPSLGGLVAVMKRRGVLDLEKMEMNSFSGICEILVSGLVDEKEKDEAETPIDTFYRSVEEELGKEAKNSIFGWIRLGEIDLKEFGKITSSGKTFYFCSLLPPKFLQYMKLSASVGGLVFIRKDDVDQIIHLESSAVSTRNGVPVFKPFVMSKSDREALEEAFSFFKQSEAEKELAGIQANAAAYIEKMQNGQRRAFIEARHERY